MVAPASLQSCICWAGAVLGHRYLQVWSFSPFLWAVWGILKFMSSPGCLSAGPDTMGTLWHSERRVCVVFNSHLARLWGKQRGKKKVVVGGVFPEQIAQPQAGKGCVGTSQPCSQEAKVMGSRLELQAVNWGGKDEGEEKSGASSGSSGRPGEHREEQSSILHSSHVRRQPGGCCDSDHNNQPGLDSASGEVSSPRAAGCLLQRQQPGAPEPARGVVCLAFCGLPPLQGQTSLGTDNPHPSLPPLVSPRGLLQSFLPGKIFCQQSCKENCNKTFLCPSPGRETGGRRGSRSREGSCSEGTHSPCSSLPSPSL